jgi:hypothetical protein
VTFEWPREEWARRRTQIFYGEALINEDGAMEDLRAGCVRESGVTG